MSRAGLVVICVLAGGLAFATGGRAADVARAPASQPLQLVLPLVAHDSALERFAAAVSNPASRSYGDYESVAWLSRHFGATSHARARVVRYLRTAGATRVRIDATGLFADATLAVGRAQRAFGVRLGHFRAPDGERFVAPAGAAAASAVAPAPPGLRGAATGVIGLDTEPVVRDAGPGLGEASTATSVAHAGSPSSAMPYSGTPTGCAAALAAHAFTPNQYVSAFDMAPLRAAGDTGQGIRVALIEVDQKPSTADLDAFARCFGLTAPPLRVFDAGAPSGAPVGVESVLDTEMLDATAPGLKEIDAYEEPEDLAGAFEAITAPIQVRSRVPQLVSESFDICEQAAVAEAGHSGVMAAEAARAELAAAGITWLTASGDSGSESSCPEHGRGVDYDASSPYVTSVGGTSFELGAANQIVSQTVWNDGGTAASNTASGGGFSSLFPRPSYQTGAVKLNHRAVPDVSMLAEEEPGIAIFCSETACQGPNSSWAPDGGTSAAAPMLAGGLALVDERLHAAGREQLGLVNPLIYALGKSSARTSAFDDVTTGNNDPFYAGDPFGAPLGCCNATVGYDEATGWGTVNVGRFARYALAAEPLVVRVAVSLPAHQRVLSSGAIRATVSCSAACELGASARVTVGGSVAFTVLSQPASLRAAGRRTVALTLSRGQISRLQQAKRQGRRMIAAVTGLLFNAAVYAVGRNPAEAIESRTASRSLAVS